MNVTLKQLRAFVAVAEAGSFAEACESLFLSQPALSVSIRKLEAAAGGRLLQRTTRSVQLTPEGRQFLPVARRLLNDCGEAFDDLHRLFAMQRGKLSIAVMPSFASNQFPAGLSRFREAYPGIDITVHDIVMEDVIDTVRSARVDLGVTFEPGVTAAEALEFLPLFMDRSVAIVPPGHRLVGQRSVGWRQLAPDPFVAMNRGSAYRGWTDAAQREAEAVPIQFLEANQLATIARMVALGLGVSVVPGLCESQVRVLGATSLRLQDPEIRRRVGIYLRRRHPASVAAQAMIDVLQREFAEPC